MTADYLEQPITPLATAARSSSVDRRRRFAWMAIVAADAGLAAWGAMAALWPEYLPGPGGAPILVAGFEGYTHGAWSDLLATAPATAAFVTILFRLLGALCFAFGALAAAVAATAFRRGERWAWWALLLGNTLAYGAPMAYDRIANAVGPFEMAEYLGLGLVYLALGLTARLVVGTQPSAEARGA